MREKKSCFLFAARDLDFVLIYLKKFAANAEKCLNFVCHQVLHMDRNDYYGGDSTSLNLNQVTCLHSLLSIFRNSPVTHFSTL